MYIRDIQTEIQEWAFQGKAIVVLGARQVGKTTLMSQLVDAFSDKKIVQLNCDDVETLEILNNTNKTELARIIGGADLLIIDEAQRIADAGLVLKRITDNYPKVQLFVTGSSSFELSSKINEPLTGRKLLFQLYPLSTNEIYKEQGLVPTRQMLENRLIFGSYPDIVNHPGKAARLLQEITSSYLYKDILSLEGIKKPDLVRRLLVALALQVTGEVSYNELAQLLGTDNKTIEKYIDILEKCFIVFRLSSFSRNLRNELKKSRKIYFYDNGIRNAVLQNYSPLSLRNDVGALWENFFISERVKSNAYSGRFVNMYFWRTTSMQEIDYIEESNGGFDLFEMKWNEKKAKTKLPEVFLKSYSINSSNVVTPENYLDFLIS
ncbi:MAG: ATP-binding protein [Bacteroidales bacterium]|nr:ATP-binding protein [Bacteroidales bacterium]